MRFSSSSGSRSGSDGDGDGGGRRAGCGKVHSILNLCSIDMFGRLVTCVRSCALPTHVFFLLPTIISLFGRKEKCELELSFLYILPPLSVALVLSPCRMDGVDGGGSGGGNGGSSANDPLATVSSEGGGGGASGGGATALPAVSTVYVTIPQAGTIVSGTSKSVSTLCSAHPPPSSSLYLIDSSRLLPMVQWSGD